MIGEKETIGFQCGESKADLVDLKFYLGGKLISDDAIYIKTYTAYWQQFISDLNSGKFNIPESLSNLDPESLFKAISSSKNEETDGIFFNHLLCLDETVDQYTIIIANYGNISRFIWECWDVNNCNHSHKLNKVYHVEISNDFITTSIKRLIDKLTIANNA